MSTPLSRRAFLQLTLASLFAGCLPPKGSPDFAGGHSAPDAFSIVTPLPPVTTSLPDSLQPPAANKTAAEFLSAWAADNYDAMFNLLSRSVRSNVSRDTFRAGYAQAFTAATATSVEPYLLSLLRDGTQAQAVFRARWQTTLFGPLDFDYSLPMVWEQAGWRVVWTQALILPQLTQERRLALIPDQRPDRGNIYDQNGLGLAVNGPRVIIGIVPGQLVDEAEVLTEVSRLTAVPPETIRNKLAAARPDWFVPIANVSPEVSINNNDLLSSLAGVNRRERTARYYKAGELAAHLVGYIGAIPTDEQQNWRLKGYQGDELVGRTGVEAWSEDVLAGKPGARLAILNRDGKTVFDLARTDAQRAGSIYLTVDQVLQADAERILGRQLGAMVVLDSRTGFVLAMASYPRFNPNLFVNGIDQATWTALSTDPNRPFVNRCTVGVYPPGSVFKIVTIAAALEKLNLTYDASFYCTGTWNRLGDQFVKTCWLKSGHGRINLQDGLTQSCDSVFYDVGLALHEINPNILPDLGRAFGLGKLTGITGVEETTGLMPDPDWKQKELGESWFPGDTVNMAIGQGFLLVTPLQIAGLLAAVGNRGTLYKPQLIQRIANPANTEQVSQPQIVGQLPVSPENLAVIRTGLERVVSGPRGTARKAFAGAPFTAAGKTGTAESGQEQPHAWFAGYCPAESPEIAIAVILEHAGEGSQAAAPLFRQMAEAYFDRQTE
ncbi:MAG: hypothetical protein FOGNACKC_03317 [Anaerolineae bacterium]|nr:hypothetical protein [Anaerolineae bacterium]